MFSGLRGIFPSKTKPTFFRRSILFSDNLPWLYFALWYSHHFAKGAYRENFDGTLVLPCAFLNFWSSSKRSSHCLSNFDIFVADSEQVESVILKISFDGDVTIAIAIKCDWWALLAERGEGGGRIAVSVRYRSKTILLLFWWGGVIAVVQDLFRGSSVGKAGKDVIKYVLLKQKSAKILRVWKGWQMSMGEISENISHAVVPEKKVPYVTKYSFS